MGIITYAAFIMLFIALLLAVIRLILGPTIADRVIALDLIAILTIALIAVYTIYSGTTVYLDIAITLALVSFLGTVAFANYLLKKNN